MIWSKCEWYVNDNFYFFLSKLFKFSKTVLNIVLCHPIYIEEQLKFLCFLTGIVATAGREKQEEPASDNNKSRL